MLLTTMYCGENEGTWDHEVKRWLGCNRRRNEACRFAGGRSHVTFLSQPKRLVFLVGSEIQPSSLESELWRKRQRQRKRERERGKNRKLLKKTRDQHLFFFYADDYNFFSLQQNYKKQEQAAHSSQRTRAERLLGWISKEGQVTKKILKNSITRNKQHKHTHTHSKCSSVCQKEKRKKKKNQTTNISL